MYVEEIASKCHAQANLAVVEFGGYAARIASSKDIWQLGPYIAQSLLLLLAPALFAATIYMLLGRIIRYTDGAHYSLVRPTWLTRLFVCGDVLSFLVQSSGGGIQASAGNNSYKTGESIIVAGLFLQLLFFGLFIVVAVVFHIRIRKAQRSSHLLPRATQEDWEKYLYALYAGSGLIVIRSVFRVIEYLMGNDGYLLRHEVFLYIFDAVPMLFVMVLFNVVHPGFLAASKERVTSYEVHQIGKQEELGSV